MTDLKPYYDRVLNAQAAVQAVVNKIDAAMKLGTPEGEDQALALEAELDAATVAAESAQKFYNKLLNATKTSNVVQNFVPITETPNDPDADKKDDKVMKLSEFQALDPKVRFAFIQANGVVED
jgi:hypothetical protein